MGKDTRELYKAQIRSEYRKLLALDVILVLLAIGSIAFLVFA